MRDIKKFFNQKQALKRITVFFLVYLCASFTGTVVYSGYDGVIENKDVFLVVLGLSLITGAIPAIIAMTIYVFMQDFSTKNRIKRIFQIIIITNLLVVLWCFKDYGLVMKIPDYNYWGTVGQICMIATLYVTIASFFWWCFHNAVIRNKSISVKNEK